MTAVCRKYKTIVIDPPWKLNPALSVKFNNRKLPYITMDDIDILNFPINNFADKDCDLFMWTTHSKLPAALMILRKWGFQYHALLTWDKESGMCINGFYRKTEFIVYAYRGKFGVDVSEGNYIPTLFNSKANGHSKKPDKFYSIIKERTQEPRIDIFARKRHFGFDAYGDQVEKEIEVPLMLASFHAHESKLT